MEPLPGEHANDCQYVAIKDNIGVVHLLGCALTAKPKTIDMLPVLNGH